MGFKIMIVYQSFSEGRYPSPATSQLIEFNSYHEAEEAIKAIDSSLQKYITVVRFYKVLK